MNIHVQGFHWIYALILLNIYGRVEMVGHIVILCFTFWGAVMNNAAMNVCVCFAWTYIFISLVYIHGSRTVDLCLTIWGTARLFSPGTHHFIFCPAVLWVFAFLCPCQYSLSLFLIIAILVGVYYFIIILLCIIVGSEL